MATKESIPCIDSIDYLKTLIPIRDTIEGWIQSGWLTLQVAKSCKVFVFYSQFYY